MELSVILVNYNDKKHLEGCLSSLEDNAQGKDLEIIVVDNNSTDGSREFIAKNFPRVRLILNKENVGFSKANNQALKECRAEFVLFLNTDTVVFPEGLSLLLQELNANPEAGAVGPALFRGENFYQVSFGKRVNFFFELIQKCFLNFFYRNVLKFRPGKREVGWLSAACLLVRTELIKDMRGFDENFFLFFEDIDLCLRLRKRGWKLIYLPQAKVFHEGGATTLPRNLKSRLEYRKSQLYFYQKYNSRISLFLLRLYLRLNFWFLTLKGNFRGVESRELQKKYFQLTRKSELKNKIE